MQRPDPIMAKKTDIKKAIKKLKSQLDHENVFNSFKIQSDLRELRKNNEYYNKKILQLEQTMRAYVTNKPITEEEMVAEAVTEIAKDVAPLVKSVLQTTIEDTLTMALQHAYNLIQKHVPQTEHKTAALLNLQHVSSLCNAAIDTMPKEIVDSK